MTGKVAHQKYVDGGICAPLGFTASGVASNGKKNSRKDLALIFSQSVAVAAGVFTRNTVKGACVLVTQRVIKAQRLQAIVINSRNANACTGEQGIQNAEKMCRLTAQVLGIQEEKVAVSSTGIIGVPLPMQRIEKGIISAAKVLNRAASIDAAEAIMTRDTFPKQVAIEVQLGEFKITIGGIAKGSGMVHPNMATILGFITTDAHISQEALRAALKQGNETSFHRISVDGETSTNDMVLIMANGLAGNPIIQKDTPEFEVFASALETVLIFLAKAVVRDAEGATKLFEMQIQGAACLEDAKIAVRAVCSSLLVKVALFGCDPNWGRILCVLGYSGAHFDPLKVDLEIGGIPVLKQGSPVPFDVEAVVKVLSQKQVVIVADLHAGKASAVGWGCDLSYDYIKINGAYLRENDRD